MKKIIIGSFVSANDAEVAIQRLQSELNVSSDNISYIYRNDDGELEDITTDPDPLDTSTDAVNDEVAEGARDGALIGGSIGALAGVATVLGAIPVIGPVFAAGPLIAALGLGAGAVGATAAAGVTGAAAGGLIGALANWGVSKEKVTSYERDVNMGNVLLIVHTHDATGVAELIDDAGATEVDVFDTE